MEGAEKILEEIYRTLGLTLTPKVIDVPIERIEVRSLDLTLDIRFSNYELERISGKIVDVPIRPTVDERLRGKIISILPVFTVNIKTDSEVINDVFIRKSPILWRDIPNELKIKLLAEIKTRWSENYSEGIEIIGIYEDIPIGRIKTIKVDERTGVLSFNLKKEFTDEKRTNLLVFKFLNDNVLRSIAF